MSAVNPYTPPRATVDDIHERVTEFSTPKVWSISGRLGRLRYMAYFVIATLIMYAALAVIGIVAALARSSGAILALIALIYIPFLVLSTMLAIQRSHDMGWSGWTVLLAIIPLAGFIWLFKAGTPGANAYGAPPPPNTTVVKVFGLFGPIVGIALIGILAAIALPAYQGYVMRAKAAQMQQQQSAPQQQQQ